MKTKMIPILITATLFLGSLLGQPAAHAAGAQILGWNNLGMHCMDSDYSVFSILPPYNTIDAQLIVAGKLITNNAGYTVSYQAIADSDGSINKSSVGKGNWLEFTPMLYGAVAGDQGLPFPGPDSFWMPGATNTPQGMLFDAGFDWFYAYGIPLTPYDDAGKKNPYPMMRLIARSSGTPIATNDIVLPVSDEMDCRACHASGSANAGKPAAGWVWSSEPERDYRLNILRLHDEREFAQHSGLYVSALGARGFNAQGLYRNVVADGKPVLCAVCHASEALGTGSYSNIPPLTASVHAHHAQVLDPELNLTLDNSANRAACYRCHPGSTTKCLRGAMGGAIASDGSMAMQCQSCHGNMSQVGRANRHGWLDEPNCQSCHSGTATANSGQIRYTSSFDTNGNVRVPANLTFSTQPNAPATGLSLFRFSAGHGGLQCEACHGSTHAEFPSTHLNDNVRNIALQGHAGMMIECTACHVSVPVNAPNAAGGPHGMHPVGQSWASQHHDFITSLAACAACHGVDYRGTVLSRAQTSRTLTANFDGGSVTLNLFRGATVGCYNCHNGPFDESINAASPPSVSNVSANTTSGKRVTMTLPVVGAGAIVQIISQPVHGSLGLTNNLATYFPDQGFVGSDKFTFAAYNGSKNSNLATGTVAVVQGVFLITAQAHVPTNYPADWPAPFSVIATASNVVGAITYDWNFGDGTPHATNQYPAHAYSASGDYNWLVIARVQSGTASATVTNSGAIHIASPILVSAAGAGGTITISWPQSLADAVLEESDRLMPPQWKPTTNLATSAGGIFAVNLNASTGNKFFRLRQVK
jgi:hypothetical protein